jgi:hypothetical protein
MSTGRGDLERVERESERDDEMRAMPLIPQNIRVDGDRDER